ncbi:hypothetical protein ACB092_03G203800 [Castanea dentata]
MVSLAFLFTPRSQLKEQLQNNLLRFFMPLIRMVYMSHWTQMFSASKQVFGVCFYNYLGTPHKLCYLKTPMSPSDGQGFCHSTFDYIFFSMQFCIVYFTL